MTNATDKFRELSASLKAYAAELRRDGVYGCCAGTYEHAAAHIDAILRESEAQGEVKDTDLWRCTVCGRVGTVGRCCGEETRERVTKGAAP